ncbi:hypothetical protein EIP86_009424 [Pleurotus ostreatoroseus]|nr:hypothetical protein EIP86_009424 [Pleurotus ostreatoroseus]
MFDVNQPQTLDALTKWWNEFRDRAPIPDEETAQFCCVLVGNKIDIPWTQPVNEVPASLAAVSRADGEASGGRVSQAQAQQFMDELIPPPLTSDTLLDATLVVSTDSVSPPKDVQAVHLYQPSPPHTNSIDIFHYHRRRHSRSRSRSTLFRGGTIGTMTSTHTLSVYQTPSSSFFDAFESARSSPIPPSSSSSTASPASSPSHSHPTSRSQSRSQPHSLSHTRTRSQSYSPVRSPQRKLSVSSALSDAQTITPSLFVRAHVALPGDGDCDAPTAPTSACTTPTPTPRARPPLPAPPEHGARLCFTSAKTGEGVPEVFEYVARRVVARWEYEEAVDARTMHVAEGSEATIRLGAREGQSAHRTWCCGS